jgi:hypothetical protein
MTDWADEKAREILDDGFDEDGFWCSIRDQIAQALRDAVAAETERCAKVAEDTHYLTGRRIAADIRAGHD